jgi:hypothetical protein
LAPREDRVPPQGLDILGNTDARGIARFVHRVRKDPESRRIPELEAYGTKAAGRAVRIAPAKPTTERDDQARRCWRTPNQRPCATA